MTVGLGMTAPGLGSLVKETRHTLFSRTRLPVHAWQAPLSVHRLHPDGHAKHLLVLESVYVPAGHVSTQVLVLAMSFFDARQLVHCFVEGPRQVLQDLSHGSHMSPVSSEVPLSTDSLENLGPRNTSCSFTRTCSSSLSFSPTVEGVISLSMAPLVSANSLPSTRIANSTVDSSMPSLLQVDWIDLTVVLMSLGSDALVLASLSAAETSRATIVVNSSY